MYKCLDSVKHYSVKRWVCFDFIHCHVWIIRHSLVEKPLRSRQKLNRREKEKEREISHCMVKKLGVNSALGCVAIIIPKKTGHEMKT